MFCPIPPSQPEILHIRELYQESFVEPVALPPQRSIDHGIPLVPGAGPVNVRPYRCPHIKKQENKAQVSETLKMGIIRPSCSPFSSPVILVQKKEGTWRLCVDYRALNQITVKDKFPIPLIDEL